MSMSKSLTPKAWAKFKEVVRMGLHCQKEHAACICDCIKNASFPDLAVDEAEALAKFASQIWKFYILEARGEDTLPTAYVIRQYMGYEDSLEDDFYLNGREVPMEDESSGPFRVTEHVPPSKEFEPIPPPASSPSYAEVVARKSPDTASIAKLEWARAAALIPKICRPQKGNNRQRRR